MTLTMPTRELVGLLADVHPFASKDDEDTAWHRVIVRWDGSRLHALAGDGVRMAWMSWGPDDGDQPTLPLDVSRDADTSWELAILPEDAKELATKFKVGAKEGEAPVYVDGNMDRLKVRRDADTGLVALTGTAMSRPWDDNSPQIDEQIAAIAERAVGAAPRKTVAYTGGLLVDFVNPKVVRQRGPVLLHFGKGASYIQIGSHFRGAVIQDSAGGSDA